MLASPLVSFPDSHTGICRFLAIGLRPVFDCENLHGIAAIVEANVKTDAQAKLRRFDVLKTLTSPPSVCVKRANACRIPIAVLPIDGAKDGVSRLLHQKSTNVFRPAERRAEARRQPRRTDPTCAGLCERICEMQLS